MKDFGGIQRYNSSVVKFLIENGIDLKIVEFKKKNLFGKFLVFFDSIWQSIIFRPDYFFCSHINFSPVVYLCNKIFKIPYIVFTHGIEVWNKLRKDKEKFLENSKTVVTVSLFTKGKLIENCPELDGKVFILPNMIDINDFYPKDKNGELIQKYNLTGKKVLFTITRLSSLEKYKGYDRVIEALPKVLKKIPNVFYIIGGEGDDKQRIVGMIKEKKLEKHVALAATINQKEKIDYYNLADVFVMPSKGEGFGIVFLEALACGKPVIAGNQDGSIDALQNGKTGILIDPSNIDAIANAIIDVLSGNIDKNLINPEFLIKSTNEAYGVEEFNKKVISLINGLQR